MKHNFDWRNVDINLSPRIRCAGLVELKSLVEKNRNGSLSHYLLDHSINIVFCLRLVNEWFYWHYCIVVKAFPLETY